MIAFWQGFAVGCIVTVLFILWTGLMIKVGYKDGLEDGRKQGVRA